ncbi:MAG: hypothetical protein PW786_14670 [Arachidicoccus sp.]|nr:hypothetical protein [Arachidicoccus sp.]
MNSDLKEEDKYNSMLSSIAVQMKDYKTAWYYEKMANEVLIKRKNNSLVDKNNNLYAQAQAEEKQELLAEAEFRNEAVTKRLEITIIIILFLLILGVFLLFPSAAKK